MESIAMFNNKGGVGKTTLLCNLAAYLCKARQKKVLVIDADPQCNSTTYALDEDEFYDVYYEPKRFTIADIVPSIEDGAGYIRKYEITKSKYFGFDMIPGNPKFATSEDFLASEWKDVKSSDLRGIKSTMLFIHFLTLCNGYDYVFFDMGPSLGAINRSILLACDYFITPMSSDVFSLLALGNIGSSISSWSKLFNKGILELDEDKKRSLDGMRQRCEIEFLGYVEQQYIMKYTGGTARAVRAYDEINYKIGSIPNFYSLVPMSQTAHKPIFELSACDGVVGAHYQKVKAFESLMNAIVDRMLNNMEALK